MTREEAITVLNMVEAHGSLVIQAKEMAIKALKQEPCEDAISRKAAIDVMIKIEQDDIDRYGCKIPEGFDSSPAIEALNDLPSVTPQPKIGHWIPKGEGDGFKNWNCSKCGMLVRNSQRPWYKYCPNCGCRMESESEEWKKNFQMQ